MRRFLSILTILLIHLSIFAINTYTGRSVLSDGKFVKLKVAETGVYKISGSDLRSLGMTPANVKVYGYGGAMLESSMAAKHIDDLPQVPIYIKSSSAERFSDNDYILFYAQGPVSWQYTGVRFRHTQNVYSDYGYYFLSNNSTQQLLLNKNDSELNETGVEHIYTFPDYQVHELDSINLIDKNGEEGGGREWYGEKFVNNTKRQFSFRFPNIVTDEDMRCYIDVASAADDVSTFTFGTNHNTIDLLVARRPSLNYIRASTAYTTSVFTPTYSDIQTINIQYKSSLANATAYLNYIEITAQRNLKMTGGILYVRNTTFYRSEKQTMFHVSDATDETQVWNVTDLDNIYSVPCSFSNGELTFVATNNRVEEFVVITPSQYSAPEVASYNKTEKYHEIKNQNLHALSDIDMVFIAPEALIAPAELLAEEHRTKDGLTTVVVTDEQIYNEFSSGTPDATAYRMFMKMLYDRALASDGTIRQPKYLLLVGDGSFDNRKILNNSPLPVLLTYQATNSVNEAEAYATDDYFGWLSDETGLNDARDSMSIAVGRLPVRDITEANNVVDKIIRYMNNLTPGKWKSQLCFLADDGNSNMHTASSDKAAEIVREEVKDFQVNKIYIDAYQQETRASGESYPLAKTKFDNLLNNGLLFFDYCGHAGYNNICNEQMLTTKQIDQMTNQNVGFWMLATCNFARFDAHITSAAEHAILNPDGGAIGLLAACRTVFAEQNDVLNKYVCQQLFKRDSTGRFVYTIGEAVKEAKRLTTIEKTSDKNKLSYILLGDPALRLAYPDEFTIHTELSSDTLNALSVQEVTGYIQTHEGKPVNDFNGKLYVSVYDKQQEISTLDNDESNQSKKVIYKFLDYPNMLFSGETQVVNGHFRFSFMIPKDIRYNFGKGRMVLYAYDDQIGGEATGYNENMVIGGSLDVEIIDETGPELRIYLNNSKFINGDKTDERPHFYADIYDENGINTIGSGIGHDLLLTIDNDRNQTYILNDYFTATSGSYQQGQVSYKMTELAEGQHSLTFRAWDLLNNSSTATLDFEVAHDLPVGIVSLLIYPNIVIEGQTIHIAIDHDRPDAAIQTEISIYDIAGYTVYSENMRGTNNLTLDSSQIGIRPGMYLVRVRVTTDGKTYTSKAGKIIVTN